MAVQMAMMVPGSPNSDCKTQLNTFCQKYTKKVISKADIVYETVKLGNQYQATLTLPCLGHAQFAGEVASSQKEAEQAAAKIALDNYAAEIATLPPSTTKNKSNNKRKATTAMDAMGGAVPNASVNNRVLLNTALMKILKRSVSKEDVSKSTVSTALGYQCTISIPALPAEWAGLAWAGEAATKEKDAEESAAAYAVQALRQDPTFAEALEAPASKKQKTAKSAGPGGPQQFAPVGELGGGAQVSLGGGGGFAWGKGGGKGKGGKGGGWKAEPKVREPVSETPVFGQVLEWKGKYGWIKPLEPVDHPSAKKNKGNIYLHLNDWQLGKETPPTKDQNVQFTLYSDSSGLGAENAVGF